MTETVRFGSHFYSININSTLVSSLVTIYRGFYFTISSHCCVFSFKLYILELTPNECNVQERIELNE